VQKSKLHTDFWPAKLGKTKKKPKLKRGKKKTNVSSLVGGPSRKRAKSQQGGLDRDIVSSNFYN